MKKILAITGSIALALSMSISAFAAINSDGGSQNIDVKAKYHDSVETPKIYDVDITWGAMEFTYTVSGTKTWNPENHQYTVSTEGSWTATGNEITVTNHSNTSIRADFAYETETGFDAVTGSFSSASITLPSAEDKATDDAALTEKAALTLSGTLADDKTEATKVGKATVTISKAE